MYLLILLTCQGLNCQQVEVISRHKDLATCEAALEKYYERIKPGAGLMCYRDEIITTSEPPSRG